MGWRRTPCFVSLFHNFHRSENPELGRLGRQGTQQGNQSFRAGPGGRCLNPNRNSRLLSLLPSSTGLNCRSRRMPEVSTKGGYRQLNSSSGTIGGGGPRARRESSLPKAGLLIFVPTATWLAVFQLSQLRRLAAAGAHLRAASGKPGLGSRIIKKRKRKPTG